MSPAFFGFGGGLIGGGIWFVEGVGSVQPM